MKHRLSIVFIALSLVMIPLIALAGRVEIYADPALTQCTLSDTSPRTANIYVSETAYLDEGVRFRVAASSGFTGVWLSEVSPFYSEGNSQSDVSIIFGTCLESQVTVLTATYQLFGTSTCSTLSVAAANGFREPICFHCNFEYPCEGYISLHVNCAGSSDCNPLAIEPTTWGRVKALYRN
jgi:hypothetical protein